jgi:hypothetical protein
MVFVQNVIGMKGAAVGAFVVKYHNPFLPMIGKMLG